MAAQLGFPTSLKELRGASEPTKFVAQERFERSYADPESAVLPLDDRAIN